MKMVRDFLELADLAGQVAVTARAIYEIDPRNGFSRVTGATWRRDLNQQLHELLEIARELEILK